MSGHSHWSKIKRSKASIDAKRGRIWSKLATRIIVAAKAGGGKPDENLTLRYAIDDAKAANMPNDTIKRAIKKGTGELGGQSYEEIIYEGFGPGGVAFIVESLTNNRNRTAPEMRKLFERADGQLGATNCVSWMFELKGLFLIPADSIDEEPLMEIALDAGADDITNTGEFFEITCPPADFRTLKQTLADKEIKTESAELTRLPSNTIMIKEEKIARQVLTLMDAFDDHEDVQNVSSNFEISEALAEKLQ